VKFFIAITVYFSLFATHAFAKPNIVFILVDDMGYGDLACYGAPDAKTPNIDRLAAEGVRFTQVYANGAECTPSRTAILTGRYAQRIGGMECAIGTGNVGRYDDAIALAQKSDLGLPAHEAALAPGLKSAGYKTSAFGKWHLGYEPKFNPLDQGFDEFRGFLGGNVDYFLHTEHSELKVMLKGREFEKREGYMTHLITKDALEFIVRQTKEDPFFLYLPYSTPHFPFQAPTDPAPKELWEWERFLSGTRAKYVEMLEDMDTKVGQILSALQKSGFSENTLVVFASDHGAMKPGFNTPFRDYKGTLFEGGIRVPLIARWPGKIKPKTESTQVGCLMDLTTSFLRAAGATAPKSLDGIDLLAHVENSRPNFSRELFWRAKRGNRTWTATRIGDLKFVRKVEGGKTEEWSFDLAQDPGEQSPLTNSAQTKMLQNALAKWETEVSAPRP